jgi:hypothetical protein
LILLFRDDLGVQGRSEDQREILDVELVAGHLLKPGSVFAFLAGHRRQLFPDQLFAHMFPSGRGWHSVPADVMAAVITHQALHRLSAPGRWTRSPATALEGRGWGLPVTAGAFHSTTLTYWRRLAAWDRPNRIFDAVKRVIAKTGVLAGRTRGALDSAVLDDAVANQDTVTQLIAAVRRVRREVPGAAGVVARYCAGHDYDVPGKPGIAWNDEQARADLVDAVVGDAHRLHGHPARAGTRPEGGRGGRAVGAGRRTGCRTVAGSDGTDGRWRIARRVALDRVVSTVDTEARHAHKTVHRRENGFKAHVAVESDTGLITDCVLTKAGGADTHDAVVGVGLLEQEADPVGVLADSAYGNGQARADLATAGHAAVISVRRCRAGSPSTTSPSTTPPAR